MKAPRAGLLILAVVACSAGVASAQSSLVTRMERHVSGQGPSAWQQQAAIKLYRKGRVHRSAVHLAGARTASACHRPVGSWWNHTIAGGAYVVKIAVLHGQWCGNGRAITSGERSWDHHTWVQWPYCLTNVARRGGWDQYPRWGHGGIWATTGVYTVALVCLPILGSEHATLRIAANLYWDRFNDFGY